MGKISEIFGKRSATISGESTVEVQQTSQQLHTPYAQRGAQRHAGKDCEHEANDPVLQINLQVGFVHLCGLLSLEFRESSDK